MRFRAGLIVGFAVGYYFGAKAGRERYQEIEQWLEKLRSAPPYLEIRSRLDELYEQGRQRAVELAKQTAADAPDTLSDLRTSLTDDFDEPTA
ncbi:MAG: hypothetical protein WHS89_14285 [Acidimicrobiales bacterium]|jgi:hypothetical protein